MVTVLGMDCYDKNKTLPVKLKNRGNMAGCWYKRSDTCNGQCLYHCINGQDAQTQVVTQTK